MNGASMPEAGSARRSLVSWRGPVLLVLVLALLLTASPIPLAPTPGHAGGARGGSGPSKAAGAVIQVAPAFAPAPGVATLGALPSSTPVQVAVGLAPSNLSSLTAIAAAVSAPGSPEYRQFLTPAELNRDFGPGPAAFARARDYFSGFGLTVAGPPTGFLLVVGGPEARVAAAFHTRFEEYRSGDRTFYSHPTPATLPALVPWTGVLGLGNETQIRPSVAPGTPIPAGTGGPSASSACTINPAVLTPCVYPIAYDYQSLLHAGTNGTGYRIGVADPYDSAEPQPQLARDFGTFTSNFSLPGGNVDFAYPLPAGNQYNTTPSDGWGFEEALDLQWARASAPGASITFAFSPYSNAGLYGAVNWLVTSAHINVLSMSWGEPDVGIYNAAVAPCPSACNASSDGSYALLHPVLVAAAALGISVFAASGDCGAAGGTSGVSTNYPASDPWTTGVGGTQLTVNSSTGAWSREVAWSGNSSGASPGGCNNGGGSGGGYAPFPRPVWQAGPGLPANGERGVPDVALNSATSAAIFYRGSETAVLGTSLATPVWAGFAAIGAQYAHGALGFLNPSLYTVLRGGSYATAFHDITAGSNGWPAGTGWDAVTGIGTPRVAVLLPLLARPTIRPTTLFVALTANRTAGPAPLTVTFGAVATGGVAPYSSYDFSFGDGNATMASARSSAHTYEIPGVYVATVVVFDHAANSTVAAPLVIVVGHGRVLPLSLRASAATVPVGGTVTFWANDTGGTAPFSYQLWFGDGTYSIPALTGASSFVARHTFGFAGGFCAVATVNDSGAPQNGGGSLPVAIAVGGGARPVCASGPPLHASLGSAVTAADLPGDLPLVWNASGGQPPLTTWLYAPDAYATLCQCGIFRTQGPETLVLYANDSLGNRTTRTLNVTLFPALVGRFTASALGGGAPLAVTFTAYLSGGHLPDANRTAWSFGDGNVSTGARVTHTYTRPGEYLATAHASDAGGGNASEAFLIDVYASSPTVPLGIGATITPATEGALGTTSFFNATGFGGAGGYAFEWNLSDGSSGFGADLATTLSSAGCPTFTACNLTVALDARDSAGNFRTQSLTLPAIFALRGSALRVAPTPGARTGTTPFRWTSAVAASGMPGLQIRWEFGDGTTLAGGSGAHAYLAPGNYTVRATITDLSGETWTYSQAVRVNGSVIPPLQLAIAAANSSCVAPCEFHLNATVRGGVPPVHITWRLPDGSVAQGGNATFNSTTPGLANVTATALDSLGENASAATSLTTYAITHVTVDLALAPSSMVGGSSFTATVTAIPSCGNFSRPPCATGPVPISLYLLESGTPAPLYGFGLGGLVPGVASTFRLSVPPFVGPHPMAAEATGPYYTGIAEVQVTITVGPTTSPAPAAVALLAVGIAVGLAAAAAAVIYERGRRPPDRPAPSPATPVAGARPAAGRAPPTGPPASP